MGIQNFPEQLQPIIQEGWLEQRFQEGLESVLGYRSIARREDIPVKIGETVTKTKPGLKAPVTTPLNPANNTNLDNGMTPSTWTVEQYTIAMAMYGDTIDLNTVTDAVGIVSQFTQNAYVNGVQAIQSLDRLARNAIYDAYMGGNTHVTETLGAPGKTIKVNDIRGFRLVFVNGELTPVAAAAGADRMIVRIGDNEYTLASYTVDGANVSTAWGGISGTLTFVEDVIVADGTIGEPVISDVAPMIIRPNGRLTTGGLLPGDKLSMSACLDVVAHLRNQGVPTIDGMYNMYLDNISARQIFADSDFKLLYQGQSATQEFRMGRVVELLDLRFIPTTEAVPQVIPGVGTVRRPIICGHGALIEGDFAGQDERTTGTNAIIDHIDGITQVTREPLDRLQQIIAQSWYWAGGFTAPTDRTVTPDIIPTASNSYLKRAVILEHM